MEISPFGLLLLNLAALRTGFFLGGLYDVMCFFRMLLGLRRLPMRSVRLLALRGVSVPEKERPRADAVVLFLFDVLWFAVAACALAVVTYSYNKGIWRFMTVAALALGVLIYRLGVSRWLLPLLGLLCVLVRRLWQWVWRILSAPFALLWRCAKKLAKKWHAALAKRREIGYNKREQQRMLLLARQGFVTEKADKEGKAKERGL